MHMHIDVYHHFPVAEGVTQRLDQILTRLDALHAQGATMTVELDTLKTKVEETTTVEQSAIELLNGLGAQIVALKNDPAQLQALADSLGSKSQELAAAVAANTQPAV